MAGKITYLNLKDFTKQGVFDEFEVKCSIGDLVFRKGDTLGQHEIKTVLDTCNKYNSFGIDTLIVQGKNDLTIWIEEKFKAASAQSEPKDNKDNQTAQPQPNHQSLPTKTVTKKYRGQVYEEVVVDWAAVQQTNQPKPRRKYRGRYVD